MLPLEQQEPEDKSLLRKYGEHQVKKQRRKLLKKGAKLAIKLAKLAAKKFAIVLSKLFAWLLGTVGLPVIGIALGVIIAIVIISLAWSFLVGTGEGLTGEDKKIHDYIVQQANNTVNMNSSIERPFRVPEKLIAATIQLDAFTKNDDIKDVIKKMATKLAPTFDYGKYDEWKEKEVTVCEDGKCNKGPIVHTENLVSKLDFVEYWNGATTYKYTSHISDWKTETKISYRAEKYMDLVLEEYVEYVQKPTYEKVLVPYIVIEYVKAVDENGKTYFRKVEVTKYREETRLVYITVPVTKTRYVWVEKTKNVEVKTITKTRYQYFTSKKDTITDYSVLDSILNSYSLSFNDKILIEANYMFMGGSIAYTDWLKTQGGGGIIGGGFFDGTIIPGGGVPPQFMPFYRSAEKAYGVDWYVLAAIHFVETGFSTHPTMISSSGAIGPLQFMPATWVGWSYNIGGGLVSPGLDLSSLSVIAIGRGYGRDGNKDGKADPWNEEDAIHTAAYYLSKNNYASDPRNAIWHYNHAEWYVNKVLQNAERFKNAATYEGGGEIPPLKPGSFMRPAVGPVSSPFGSRWGSVHYGIDIASGGKSQVPIVATADGTVSRSYYSTSYGNVVFIKHTIGGQEFETIYAHMTNRAVSQGAIVKQGQFLGFMSSTGDSTGVHLHFEVHRPSWTSNKQNAINPALVVQF